MKSSRMMLMLAMVTVMSVAMNAVDLEQYLVGDKVDAEGKTFLHKLAENCDNDHFKIELELFNGLEKRLQPEIAQLVKIVSMSPEGLQDVYMFGRAKEIVMAKDNNSETALDILKRKNAVENSCDRCKHGMELLEIFHEMFETLEEN